MPDGDTFNVQLGAMLAWVLRSSASAAIVAVLVMAVQVAFARWITPAWRYRMWGLVLLRLLLPALVASPISLWNLGLPASAKTLSARWGRERISVAPPRQPLVAPMADAAADPNSPVVVTVLTTPSGSGPAVQPGAGLGNVSRPRSARIHLPVILAAAWLAGAAILFVRLLLANVNLNRRLRCATLTNDLSLRGRFEGCCRLAGVRRVPLLLFTDAVRSPSTAGLWRPLILIPTGLFDKLSVPDQQHVLLHELTHVRCRDIAVTWLLAVVQIIHWFNPVLWLAFARLRDDRELARDATVLRLLSVGHARLYARTLLKVSEQVSHASGYATATPVPGIFGPPAPAMISGRRRNHSSLKRRIQMSASFSNARSKLSFLGPVLAFVLASCTLTGAKTSPPRQVAETAPAASPKPSAPSVQEKLDHRLPELQFDAVGLSDAIDFFRDVSGANIFVDWKALEAAGVNRNTPVFARLRDVTFSKSLQVVLDSVSGGQKKIAYAVDEGVITISTRDELSKNVTVRVYDIRDLLVIVPDVEPDETSTSRPSDAQGASSRPSSVPRTTPSRSPSRDELVKQIITLIEDTVASDGWKDRGGSICALRELQGQLIVTQTPENQREIVKLLEQLRESRSIQVQVAARCISCRESVVAELLSKWQKTTTPIKQPTPIDRPAMLRSSAGFGVFLDDAQVNQLLRARERSPQSAVLTAPRLTLFNGQRARVKATSPRQYVRDYATVRTPQGDTRYEAINATADPGLILDVQATVSADRKYVTLTLRPKVSALLGMNSAPWPSRPPGSNQLVQEPRMKVSELQTTVTVPDQGTVLLGGLQDPGIGNSDLTGQPAKQPAAPAEAESAGHLRAIFLLVKPFVILHPMAEQKPWPLLHPKGQN